MMNKSVKHTLGPWHTSHEDHVVMGAKGGYGLLEIVKGDRPLAECEANCRLASAAPELLEACKALQMEAKARNCGLKIADDAIAKAENGRKRFCE